LSGIKLQLPTMRDCRVCGIQESVTTVRGPASCPACRRAKYLIVKRRYQQSEKGKATARAREERTDVREKRRLAAVSPQGLANKRKYEATPEGKATRAKAVRKYAVTERCKRMRADHHLRTKDTPQRIEQRAHANERYAKSDKMAAKKHRDYARRKAAIVADRPVTAEDWLEIVRLHKNRCHYCKRRRTLTIDHVMPLSKGGLHVKENIVPACKTCNSTKKDRLIRLC